MTASRLAELERELAEMRAALHDKDRQIIALRRQLDRARGRDEPPAPRSGPRLDPARAQAEADRCLVEGLRLHRTGERKEATRLFQRGLALVPGHADLLRALRLYA